MSPSELDQYIPERINRLSRDVIGAAIEVHRTMGPGYLEAAYEAAMAIELGLRTIPFQRQVPQQIAYKGQPITTNWLDLVIDTQLVVELKAVEAIHRVHRAQLLSYMKAGGFPLGLLVNFNVPRLVEGVSRVVLTTPPLE
jgi:GxxExxY protein